MRARLIYRSAPPKLDCHPESGLERQRVLHEDRGGMWRGADCHRQALQDSGSQGAVTREAPRGPCLSQWDQLARRHLGLGETLLRSSFWLLQTAASVPRLRLRRRRRRRRRPLRRVWWWEALHAAACAVAEGY